MRCTVERLAEVAERLLLAAVRPCSLLRSSSTIMRGIALAACRTMPTRHGAVDAQADEEDGEGSV